MAGRGGGRVCVSLACLLVASLTILLSKQAQHVAAGSIKVEGWTEVRAGWPLEREDYFVATEKGHHSIELRDIPVNLAGHLDVHLEYYYNYSRAQPLIQMIPCRSNIIVLDKSSNESSNDWRSHNIRVRREDCQQRNQLAYNILLHDPGDMFAWRLITVKTVPASMADTAGPSEGSSPADEQEQSSESTPVTSSPLASEEPDEQSTTTTPSPASPDANQAEVENMINDDSNATAAPSADPASSVSSEPTPAEQPSSSSSSRTPTEEPTETPTEAANDSRGESEQEPQEEGKDGTEEAGAGKADKSAESAEELAKPFHDQAESSRADLDEGAAPEASQQELSSSEKSTLEPGSEKPGDQESSEGKSDKEPAREGADARQRHKRMAGAEAGDAAGDFSEECRPSKCDRAKFKMARFSPLFSGVPKLPAGASLGDSNKLFLRLNNDKPLKIKVESGRRLSELDPCLEFSLLIEDEAELELLIEKPEMEPASGSRSVRTQPESRPEQSLEFIGRRAINQSSGGQWQKFRRCISDYMPKLQMPERAENSIRFLLRSKPDKANAARAGQTAILLSERPEEATLLRALFPTQSYLPDVRLISNVSTLNRFWIMDRDGLREPKLELTGSLSKADRGLSISNIDPSRATFDITSRWIAVKDAELLEEPFLLVYRTRQADWVQKIELQYQRAGANYNDWLSQTAYVAREKNETTPTGSGSASGGPLAPTHQAEPASSDAGSETKKRLIDLPIRLKGLDSSEFRIRLRHHAFPAKTNGYPSLVDSVIRPARSLEVRALALADACTYRPNYCLNAGLCRPTGPAKAECLCLQGYSGARCEHQKPCEILYGDRTGFQICQSVGARCVQGLPVMRCEWPNDSFYKCHKLYKLDADGQLDNSSLANSYEVGEPSGTKDPEGRNQTGRATPAGLGRLEDGREFESLSKEEQIGVLAGIVNRQARLVIILAVFIIAILVFAVVLVGSMVVRLHKSSRRLRQARSDFQQMARRASETPGSGTSGAAAAAFGTTSFGRPAAGRVGFTNSAFDVE